MAADLDDTVVRAPRAAEVVADVLDGDTIPIGNRPPVVAAAAPTIPIELPEPLAVAPSRAPRLRLPGGREIDLDQPVYLGRRPSLPRVHPGGSPVLITLESPGREMSSTHLAVSAVGATVVARDMLSTNGSVVRVPGAEPRVLLRGESAVLTPGTVVDLGDGNELEVLVP